MYPIIGVGSLPFRGGLQPERVEDFIKEYKGVRTVTIQSAFRYDNPLEKVISAVATLEKELPENEAEEISQEEEAILLSLMREGGRRYEEVVSRIAPMVGTLAMHIPRRRERFSHVGLFAYARKNHEVTLPRAIPFTCILYSLGIPPEFIGTGRTISLAIKTNHVTTLEKYYLNLKKDLMEAGRFLNKANLKKLAKTSPAWRNVVKDIEIIEKYIGIELNPITEEEKEHFMLTGKMLSGINDVELLPDLIRRAAVLRKSLG